jgi:hypothetical protein
MRAFILLLMPWCVAWQASGDGVVEWARGEAKAAGPGAFVQAGVVARVEPGAGVSIVATLDLPGADGLLTVRAEPPPPAGATVELPDPRVKVGYTEYAADGTVRFSLERVTAGRLRMPPHAASPFDLRLELDAESGDGAWRRLRDGELVLVPSVPPARDDDDVRGPRPVDVDPVYDTGGCGGAYHDTDYDDDYGDSAGSAGGGGCEGDDLESDGGGDASGCEGDDLGGGGGSGSGCAGDDVASSGGGCDGGGADSCAVAPAGPRVGRAWQRRTVAWLPWTACFAGLRLMRGRKRTRERV